MSFQHQASRAKSNVNNNAASKSNHKKLDSKKSIAQMKSGAMSHEDISHLQKSHGNQALQRMLVNQQQPVQRLEMPEEEELQMKPEGEPIQKMEMPEEEELQMKPAGEPIQKMEMPEEEELQMKPASEPLQKMEMPEEEELQMKPAGEPIQKIEMPEEEELQMKPASEPVQRKSPSGGLPDGLKEQMESAMGSDFSDVKINEGGEAESVNALAYAQGNDLHFAPGQYNPESEEGRSLLGHELAHVVQQREGRVKTTTQANGMPVNDDPSLEKEADDLGSKAAKHSITKSDADYSGNSEHQSSATAALQAKSNGFPIQMWPFSKKKSSSSTA